MIFPSLFNYIHPHIPLKIGNPKRKLIFQSSIFRGYVKFPGCWWFLVSMLKFQGCSIWWLHLRVPSLQLTYIDPIKLPSEKKGFTQTSNKQFSMKMLVSGRLQYHHVLKKPLWYKTIRIQIARRFMSVWVTKAGVSPEIPLAAATRASNSSAFIIFKEPTVSMVQEVAAKKNIHTFLLSLDQKILSSPRYLVSFW